MTVYKKKKLWYVLGILALFCVVCAVAIAIYAGDYYRATDEAAAYEVPNVSEYELSDGVRVYEPADDAVAGFIFYPGGKVEYTAYEPLMKECAARGLLCVLVKMPLNLAVLDMNAADGIVEHFPEVDNWYIGGHSLGGAMAASYVSSHTDDFRGLVLLGAYSTADLTGTELRVLSVLGTRDGVTDREKYDECLANLPSDLRELLLEGGNHAYFGMYGEQKGDGKADMENQRQIEMTADAIAGFVD